MQTRIASEYQDRPEAVYAEQVLRACVHCGFCLATCPTYQLLGSELDSPRGRIYLLKQLIEGEQVTARTRLHLDRCLTCRACESTCPSGVKYSRLLDFGRVEIERKAPRSAMSRLFRRLLREVMTRRRLFGAMVAAGRPLRGLMSRKLRSLLPAPLAVPAMLSTPVGARRVLLLDGCVQPALAPEINAAAQRVFARAGMDLQPIAGAGCCGAINQHMGAEEAARIQARTNIDAWWPEIEAGADAICITASGCGVLVKEYDQLLQHDPDYAERAARIASLAMDPAELLIDADLGQPGTGQRLAFHAPCTLQHGQRLPGVTERLLTRLGFELTPVTDAHLCCGSAGTYSLFQPDISTALRDRKLAALEGPAPEQIATANIGCMMHLQSGTGRPVRHWLCIVDQQLSTP